MARRETQELMSFDFEDDVNIYKVEAYVTEIELRKGNYSSVASDPDEYFGEYIYRLDYIEEVCVQDKYVGSEVYFEGYELENAKDGDLHQLNMMLVEEIELELGL